MKFSNKQKVITGLAMLLIVAVVCMIFAYKKITATDSITGAVSWIFLTHLIAEILGFFAVSLVWSGIKNRKTRKGVKIEADAGIEASV